MDALVPRDDFPFLKEHPELIYLDSAATSQKPQAVLQALLEHYTRRNANVHRGAYALAEEATQAYEEARAEVARFIGALPEEIVFTRNATEALNLVAQAWGRRHLLPNDAILVSEMEHHAGLVPWQLVAAEREAQIRAIPLDERGRLDLDNLDSLLDGVRVVSLVHLSNVLGTLNPVREIAQRAHARGALVVLDGAQSVPHLPVDVRELGVDFLAFSGHKMLGPTGIGVLWGKEEHLAELDPFLAGGEMIDEVFLERSTFAPPPHRFEAGTPAVAEAVALAEAIRYLQRVGLQKIWEHDQALTRYALDRLTELSEVKVFGPQGPDRGGVVAFTLGRLHGHDLATFLDQHQIAVRSGHHCTQPLHRRLGVSSTVRASFYLYTTQDDIDRLVEALAEARTFFRGWF
jgi:cysteine desulfurase/selenocysteine lyase